MLALCLIIICESDFSSHSTLWCVTVNIRASSLRGSLLVLVWFQKRNVVGNGIRIGFRLSVSFSQQMGKKKKIIRHPFPSVARMGWAYILQKQKAFFRNRVITQARSVQFIRVRVSVTPHTHTHARAHIYKLKACRICSHNVVSLPASPA